MLNERKVIIIGAGSVGKSLGYLLAKNEYEILGFISKSLKSAQAGVDLIEQGMASTEYEDFILKADLILITTPDQAIQRVAHELFKQDLVQEGSCLTHCSGALTSEVLIPEAVVEEKYNRLSLHPLQSIADVKNGINNLPESFFTIEGDEGGREIGEVFLERLGADYEVISSQAKPVYHAAACVASNYLVAITDLAVMMNQAAGISTEDALTGLLPLMKGTLNNIQSLGSTQALTGPIERGDTEIIQNHLDALQNLLPGRLELYQKLGSYTAEIAKKKGSIDDKQYEKLSKILQQRRVNDE